MPYASVEAALARPAITPTNRKAIRKLVAERQAIKLSDRYSYRLEHNTRQLALLTGLSLSEVNTRY